ncbi:TRAP transporter small permease [Marinobacterium mangrovicola]|uniref:TRAP transporter small permease protein n=1 Tax=Marinobacterium mangrovicola TaxID=1476959 RepID=A0A4R1GXZ3_9GAMM|nr:TRAP transporter small permease [Marinobacterium mangrovicola]TCK09332.1 TRAP-type C4-dicarboxylate transport system permease small subunit [Marinobacterium mangrovicola]
MLRSFDNLLAWVATALTLSGMLALLGAVLLTVTDILLRLFAGYSISGVVDLTQLAVMFAAFFSIPYAFKQGSHVFVSLLSDQFGPVGRQLIEVAGLVLAAIFVGLIDWFSWQQAMLELSYGDVSQTLGIPKLYYWIPLLAGMGLSTLLCMSRLMVCLAALCSSNLRQGVEHGT